MMLELIYWMLSSKASMLKISKRCHSSSNGMVKVKGKDDDKDEDMTNKPACLIDLTDFFVKDKTCNPLRKDLK